MKKRWKFVLVLSLISLIVFWISLVLKIKNFNCERHSLYLSDAIVKNGMYCDDNVAIRLGARGEGTDELSCWQTVEGKENDYGWVPGRSFEAVIYELEIVNLSPDKISNWGFHIAFNEEVFLNAGWNGIFNVHQTTDDGVIEQPFSAGDFKGDLTSLEHFYVNDVFMIPLQIGDSFDYSAVESAQEIPILGADAKKNIAYSKTIGFVLYIEDKDPGYLTTFNDGVVVYELHRNITDTFEFYILVVASFIWFLWVSIIIAVIRQDKKFKEKRERDMAIIEQSMQVFIEFIEAKDPSTKGHSLRVAQYSKKIATYLNMPEEECRNIYFIGMLHDCGKVSIPGSILCKPSGLTDEEYAIMKSHAKRGYDMLQKFDAIPNIGDGALCHHERFDGLGYPSGLKGSEIPLVGRIICVADAFDAMTWIRCYQDPLPKEEVLKQLYEDRGKHFDPVVVDALLSLIKSGEIEIPDQSSVLEAN